jgi:hypothetical protein
MADVAGPPDLSRGTNGWVAVGGSLLILVGTLAASMVAWSVIPVWLARGAQEAPRPALARRVVAVPEPLRVPVPPPEPVQTDPYAPAAPPSVKSVVSASHAAEPLSGVGEALDAYRRAFNTLDAASVAAIWPGADVDTLARSFSELRYQHLSFDRCQTRVTGADRALASCDGSISDVLNSGDPTVRRRRASWTIALQRIAGRWTIESISAS